MSETRVGARGLDRARDRDDVGHVGAQLHDERALRGRSARGRDRGRRRAVGAERHAALIDVGARDVDLVGRRRPARSSSRSIDPHVLLDAVPAHVHDDRRVGGVRGQPARSFAMNASTPGFCRPIELSMPLAVSAIARAGVAGPRLERDALGHDRAEARQVDEVARTPGRTRTCPTRSSPGSQLERAERTLKSTFMLMADHLLRTGAAARGSTGRCDSRHAREGAVPTATGV